MTNARARKEDELVRSGVPACRHGGVLRRRSTCGDHGPAFRAGCDAMNAHAEKCKTCHTATNAPDFDREDLCAAGIALMEALRLGDVLVDRPAVEDEQWGDGPGDRPSGQR